MHVINDLLHNYVILFLTELNKCMHTHTLSVSLSQYVLLHCRRLSQYVLFHCRRLVADAENSHNNLFHVFQFCTRHFQFHVSLSTTFQQTVDPAHHHTNSPVSQWRELNNVEQFQCQSSLGEVRALTLQFMSHGCERWATTDSVVCRVTVLPSVDSWLYEYKALHDNDDQAG